FIFGILRGEGIEVANALMVLGIPEETDIGTIETTLETIKVLGKVRVRGKIFEPVSKTLTVLCECREQIDSSKVPLVFENEEGDEWTLVMAEIETSSNLFSEKLDKFLQEEGKTREDIKVLCGPALSWNQNPESIIRAVSDALQPTRTHENTHKTKHKRSRRVHCLYQYSQCTHSKFRYP
uniref:Paraneoplastic antigen Ma-like N-terminal domain-containing protein n=1 Tax=Neogobius melanostomus TaxID=47308 RepID=A0A8C6UAI5_9GOBI